MLKVIGICFGLAIVLVTVGSLLPESKVDTTTAHYACTSNKDNQTEAMFRAMANGKGSSDLAVARELNNICRNFSNY